MDSADFLLKLCSWVEIIVVTRGPRYAVACYFYQNYQCLRCRIILQWDTLPGVARKYEISNERILLYLCLGVTLFGILEIQVGSIPVFVVKNRVCRL
ncbi:hypothetical protein AS219_00315 [Neorickettsia sp. 179522]|nr:hypothetical protein AS219_00315 [Neorickettsia sp. 179522]